VEIPIEFLNNIILGDCLQILKEIPDNSIDLIFIDPPYNLGKPYNVYQDKKREKEYIEWSQKWLLESVRILKPTGSLFVVNIPKWSLHYMLFLNKMLYLQHAIAWFGLSEPRGKIIPAHYTILWYTKSKRNFKFNRKILSKIKAYPRHVCLRHKWKSIHSSRLIPNEVEKYFEELSDVWYDIHRLKHRGKRVEAHPCQLPEKLLERIILLTTDRNDIVLDPMCGTGTTLVVAKKYGRRYIGIDIDPLYVEIAKKRLKMMPKSITDYLSLDDF